jgi:hypothetical protein
MERRLHRLIADGDRAGTCASYRQEVVVATKEIPRESWTSLLDGFSRRHEMIPVSVEVVGDDLGDQEEIRDHPLLGITADVRLQEEVISVIVRRDKMDHMTHIIDSPERVWLQEDGAPAKEALEVESAGGLKTIIRFRS